MTSAAEFAARVRRGDQVVGCWLSLDAPPAAERLARAGFDYLVVDRQHGLVDQAAMLRALIAVEAGGGPTALVRVPAAEQSVIGQALDAGACGVIVPLVNSAEEAAGVVAWCRYPPLGVRSYGPTRSGLRIGPRPAEANAAVLVFAMVETQAGLESVERIAATPGLDGIYVGPSDLALGIGARYPGDPEVAADFSRALERIRSACADAGIAAGIHCLSGDVAARRLAEGFTFVTAASDLVDLERGAKAQLALALALRLRLRSRHLPTLAPRPPVASVGRWRERG